MSRQNHRKEGNLIAAIWNNVTATQVEEDRYKIHHKYQYRHDADEVYKPENSNIFDAAGHSRKVLRRKFRNGTLHLLEEQGQKMINKEYFVEREIQEMLKLSSQPHLFTYYNYVSTA